MHDDQDAAVVLVARRGRDRTLSLTLLGLQ